jgi:hypothetical protein
LYRKDKKLGALKPWTLYSLAGSRFLSVFIILFLLLSPVFRYLKLIFEEPLIIVAFDNSESLKKYQSSGNRDQLLKGLPEMLQQDFKVKTYLFGDRLSENKSIDYSGQETDFDPLFQEIEKKYTNYNVGALIIASDGIYNKGTNPVYGASDLTFPVYTIALGDTDKRNDIVVKNIYTNKIAFTGDLFPVEVLINAYGFAGQQANLRIFNQGKEINNIPIDFKQADFSTLLKFDIKAEKSGLQTYTFSIEPKKGEYNTENNSQELVIDIVDNKKKVLILSLSVHPDIGAIQKALEMNKSVSTEFYTIDDFKKPIAEYQLVIFHQLPSVQNNLQKLLEQLTKNRVPVLFIFGQNTDIQAFNLIKNGIQLKRNKGLFEQALPVLNQNFKLFETDPAFGDFIKECPPLNVPFAEFELSDEMSTMLFQRIKGVNTNYPLLAFSQARGNEQIKFGAIFGDGIWQWRLKNYMMYENHLQFDDFINKIVNYLAIDIKKERFMVFSSKMYKENEEINIKAEFYNESYELLNTPNVEMVVTNENQKEYHYQLERSGKSYNLDAGLLPVGSYRYNATTVFDNKKFQKAGEFKVVPLNVEFLDLSANHNLLKQLSARTGAKTFSINELNKLSEDLKKNENIKRISHSTIDLVGLNELKYLLIVIILLLSVEWFTRKYFGAY